eukprot:jgi/Botrbrau1/10752/Bobra.180_2s0017.1
MNFVYLIIMSSFIKKGTGRLPSHSLLQLRSQLCHGITQLSLSIQKTLKRLPVPEPNCLKFPKWSPYLLQTNLCVTFKDVQFEGANCIAIYRYILYIDVGQGFSQSYKYAGAANFGG